MSSKRRKVATGALLGAAATALTVKSALTGPLAPAAEPPLNEVEKNLRQVKEAGVVKTRAAVDQAQAQLQSAMLGGTLGAVRGTSLMPLKSRSPQPIAPAGQWTNSRSRPVIIDDPPNRARARERGLVHVILRDAAIRHGLDPRLVLALSYWESGWDESKVSATGAVGLMQVEPDSAAEAGPALLGRPVDLNDAYDNADVGAAIFRQYLDAFGSPSEALAAYYQGPTSLKAYGMFPDTQQYVQGILDLTRQMSV
jgi:soluble lytic murein transglycosylase-like protein